ncbi:hypothetical protein Lupro_00660 [Lutibacter profundi]|uniref:Peptidase E n=1 Tax=Lutibacter profundi TaxID=1622118 RepID=A0A109RN57_9FLAO|nr:DUF6702 family protein [Lutibacter profundi]AMC09862.1 hypothetical protein Lupro_00660 [Lutibacter profundi]
MKHLKYFTLLIVIPLLAFSVHKYYISLCEIEYVEEQKSIQITLGMFIDDLEVTLNKSNDTILNLATTDEVKNIDKYYKSYLNKHFKIIVNNKLQIYNYIGKEYDGDLVRFYLEITNIKSINSIEVINNCLFETFEDQENIIKIKANNINKTFYLNRKNDKGLLKF